MSARAPNVLPRSAIGSVGTVDREIRIAQWRPSEVISEPRGEVLSDQRVADRLVALEGLVAQLKTVVDTDVVK